MTEISIDSQHVVTTFLVVFDLTGTFIFALSGAMAAVKHRLDAFGVLVLCFATGNAGGIARRDDWSSFTRGDQRLALWDCFHFGRIDCIFCKPEVIRFVPSCPWSGHSQNNKTNVEYGSGKVRKVDVKRPTAENTLIIEGD